MDDSPWFGEHPKRSIVKAGAWATAANVSNAALTLFGTVVLSRLLEPSEVGLFTLAFSFYSIPSLIVGPGLTAAAVQAAHLTRHQSSNLFWINIAANTVMAAILVAMAPSLAGWFHQPSLQALCPVFALILILEGFATQYRALLTRAMRFDLVAKIGFAIGLVSLSVAVVLAALGRVGSGHAGIRRSSGRPHRTCRGGSLEALVVRSGNVGTSTDPLFWRKQPRSGHAHALFPVSIDPDGEIRIG